MPTPAEAARLLLDEASIEQRKFRFARELDEAKEERLLKRNLRGQMEAATNPGSGLLPTVAALTKHEIKSYSIVKGLQDQLKESRELTLESEISHSIAKDIRKGTEHSGLWMPLRFTMSGLDSKTNAQGGYLAERRVADVIDYLTQQTRVLALGARFVSGLRYSQQFPTELAAPEATWVSENPGSDVGADDASFGMRTASPHALQSCTSISRQLLQQANQNLEGWLRNRLARSHGLALDRAALYGSGTENQPLGLLNTADIGDVAAGANGAAVTAAMILSMEAAIGSANADSPSCAWLTRPAQRTKLRGVLEVTAGGLPLWRDGRMLDYPAYVSNQVPSDLVKGNTSDNTAVVFGDWSQMMVCEFDGAIEVMVDPVTLARRGMVELCSYGTYDIVVLQPSAFVAIQDAR